MQRLVWVIFVGLLLAATRGIGNDSHRLPWTVTEKRKVEGGISLSEEGNEEIDAFVVKSSRLQALDQQRL